MWAGKVEAHGGQCTVAWETVGSPKWAGGLGLPDFKWLNFALRARWLWLQRVDGACPWTDLRISVWKESKAIYQAAVFVDVGNGQASIFWEDRWLDGWRVQQIAPRLYDQVSPSECNENGL